MDKDKLSAIVSIIISAVLAILAVFGYNLVIVQPALSSIAAQVGTPLGASRAINAAPYYESLYVDKELTNAGTLTQTGAVQGANPFVFEGATDDAYETTFAVTDPAGSDKTITFPNASGTVALNPAAGTWEFEGTTANDYETTLTVTDPTADRTVTVPDASGYVMLGGGTGKYVLGTNTITGTLTVAHGLTTPQAVFCTLIQDSEANAATCTATISGSTVVVKTWKADGATPASVGKLVSWMVTGQP